MSLVNTSMSEFQAEAFENGEFINIDSEHFKGRWLVLVFYPADFTFVCPTELGDLADHYEVFKKLDVELCAVSTDSHWCHKAWWDTSETIAKVQYPMISDNTLTISESFGVLRQNEGRADRATFIIDPDGTIQAREVTAEGIGRDASELVRKLKAAIYVRGHPDERCPAKWNEGEETLAPSLDLVGRI